MIGCSMQSYLAFAMKSEDHSAHRPPSTRPSRNSTRPSRNVAFCRFPIPNAAARCQQPGFHSDGPGFGSAVQTHLVRSSGPNFASIIRQSSGFSASWFRAPLASLAADPCNPHHGRSFARRGVEKEHALSPAKAPAQSDFATWYPHGIASARKSVQGTAAPAAGVPKHRSCHVASFKNRSADSSLHPSIITTT